MRAGEVTIAPWSSGKPLVWDATCPLLSLTGVLLFTLLAGLQPKPGPQESEICRSAQFPHYCLIPLLLKPLVLSLNCFETKTLSFVKSLGRRLYRHSSDPKSTSYLIQCLSIAIQWGNAISILGAHLFRRSCRNFSIIVH